MYLFIFANRPAYFTFYDFSWLLTTFVREYNYVLTSWDFSKLLWRCITVALFLKIKKACNRLYNQFTGLRQVGRGGIRPLFIRLLPTFLHFQYAHFLRSRGIIAFLDFSQLSWGCITVAFKFACYKNIQLFYKFELRTI